MSEMHTILNEVDDESLILGVLTEITTKPDFDINQVPDAQRNAIAVVTAQAIIDDGGFRYFLESYYAGKPNYKMFVHAYDQVGASDAADAINQALLLFPDGELPEDMEEREKHISAVFDDSPQHSKKLSEIEDKISGNDENYILVANYIRNNKDQFM